MTRERRLVLPMLFAVAVPLAIAGGGRYKCTMSAQECLDMMVASLSKKGWVGADFGETEGGRPMVKKVVRDGPAARAGFREGDVVTAVNGVAYDDESHEAIKKQWDQSVMGKTMTFTVLRSGSEKTLAVTLAKMPREMMAAYVGNHMLDHITPASTKE